MILCALFVSLIAAGAFIRIPVPVIPITLQFLFTMLAGLLLGGKWGCVSVLLYLVIGLLGLPVFAEGGGFSYVLKPSFGYIIGFAVGALVTGTIANKVERPGYKRLIAANVLGLGIVYLFGLVYCFCISHFYLGTSMGLWTLLVYGFLLTVPGDLVLCILGAILGKRLIPLVKMDRM